MRNSSIAAARRWPLLQLWLGVRDGSARSFVLALHLAVLPVSAQHLSRDVSLPRHGGVRGRSTGGRARREAAARVARRASSRRRGECCARRGRSPNGFAVSVVVAVVIAAATLAMFAGYAHTAHEYKFAAGGRNREPCCGGRSASLLMAAIALLGAVVLGAFGRDADGAGAQPVHRFRRAGVLPRRTARRGAKFRRRAGCGAGARLAISLLVVALLTLDFGPGFRALSSARRHSPASARLARSRGSVWCWRFRRRSSRRSGCDR